MLSLAVFLPIVCGLLLLLLGRSVGHRMRQVLVETVTVVTSLLVLFCLLNRRGMVYTPFYLLPSLPIRFAIDGVGSVFTAIVAFRWPRCMDLSIWSMRAAKTTFSRSIPSPMA